MSHKLWDIELFENAMANFRILDDCLLGLWLTISIGMIQVLLHCSYVLKNGILVIDGIDPDTVVEVKNGTTPLASISTGHSTPKVQFYTHKCNSLSRHIGQHCRRACPPLYKRRDIQRITLFVTRNSQPSSSSATSTLRFFVKDWSRPPTGLDWLDKQICLRSLRLGRNEADGVSENDVSGEGKSVRLVLLPDRIPRLHQAYDLVLTISKRIVFLTLSIHVKE